jgi:hypothetical protein
MTIVVIDGILCREEERILVPAWMLSDPNQNLPEEATSPGSPYAGLPLDLDELPNAVRSRKDT